MKRTFVFALLLSVLSLCACGTPSSSSVPSSSSISSSEPVPTLDKLKFELSGDETFYRVSCFNEEIEGEVVIPSSYQGVPVTFIDDFGFYGCSHMTSLSLPEGITDIGYEAFGECSSLTSILLPASLTFLDEGVFVGCEKLTSIEVASDNESFSSKDGVLYSKDGSSLVLFPYGKKGAYVVADTVSTIDAWAFKGCDQLSSISLPYSLVSIADGAFYDCASLTSIALPSKVSFIGEYAFEGCASLEEFEAMEVNPHFSSRDGVLFDENMEELVLYPQGKKGAYEAPSSVTSVSGRAFFGCAFLTSVTFSSGVTLIDHMAFASCEGLKSVILPNTLSSIGRKAFFDCRELDSLTFEGTVEQWERVEKGDSWSENVPATSVHCSDGDASLN